MDQDRCDETWLKEASVDQHQFDEFARRLAQPLTRRGGLRGSAAAIAGLTVGIPAADAARKASRRHEKLACRNLHSQCTSDDQCCTNNCAPVPPYEGTGFRCARGHHRRKGDGKKNGGGGVDPCDQTCTVCPTCAYTTITAAVMNAQSGSTIFIAPGIYEEEIVLVGDGPSVLTFDRCGCTGEVIWRGVPAGSQSSGPQPQGPGYYPCTLGVIGERDVTIRNISMVGSPSAGFANAQILVANDPINNLSTFRADAVVFRDMLTADSYGVAPLLISGRVSASVENCTFQNNTRYYTGGVEFMGTRDGSALAITNSLFTENSGRAHAGAIHVEGASLTVSDTTITANECYEEFGGGAVTLYPGTSATFTDSTISANVGTGVGGGFYVVADVDEVGASIDLTLAGTTTVTGNTAGSVAGGLAVDGTFATVTGATTRVSGNNPDQCAERTDGVNWTIVAGCAY